MSNGLWTRPLPGPELPTVPVPAGFVVAPVVQDDLDAVGAAYLAASPPGTMADLTEAVADVRAAWTGAYGTWLPAASLVARAADGAVAAVVETTRDVPWEDCPRGPFLVDLFTVPQHRGRGLARYLLVRALTVLLTEGYGQVGLRVEDDDVAARRLYADLGFGPAAPV